MLNVKAPPPIVVRQLKLSATAMTSEPICCGTMNAGLDYQRALVIIDSHCQASPRPIATPKQATLERPVFFLVLDVVRHLGDAAYTISCPELDQHDFAAQFGKRQLFARERRERDLGRFGTRRSEEPRADSAQPR